jgi:hypothetical protein
MFWFKSNFFLQGLINSGQETVPVPGHPAIELKIVGGMIGLELDPKIGKIFYYCP